MPLNAYIPAGLAIAFVLAFVGLMVILAAKLGPKRPSKIKGMPFECGNDPIGSPRARFSIKFYQVAILFLVFDVEIAFMYPWAVNYRELSVDALGQRSMFGFIEMSVFVVILVGALTYAWRKKAIGWD